MRAFLLHDFKGLFFALCICVSTQISAQNATISQKEDQNTFEFYPMGSKILVIPYTDRLYRSELDAKLKYATKKEQSIQKLRSDIKKHLVFALQHRIDTSIERASTLNVYKVFADSTESLAEVYGALSYVWIEKQQQKDTLQPDLIGRVKNKLIKPKKMQKDVAVKSEVKHGQLSEKKMAAKKFMHAEFKKQVDELTFFNSNKVVSTISLNQLDVLHTYNQYNPYLIKAHFTYFDADLKSKQSGTEVLYFQDTELAFSDFRDIVLPVLADKIAKACKF